MTIRNNFFWVHVKFITVCHNFSESKDCIMCKCEKRKDDENNGNNDNSGKHLKPTGSKGLYLRC